MEITERYAESHRHYHTLDHIWEMLDIFGACSWPLNTEQIQTVLWAIWYHDAIYNPRATDNEEQSALLFKTEHGEELPDIVDDVMRLVRSTAAHNPQADDEKVLSDLDLAVLGTERIRYSQYVDGIQQEYDFVPWETYLVKRGEILQGFLDRPQIYYFLDLEAKARENITWELGLLALGW